MPKKIHLSFHDYLNDILGSLYPVSNFDVWDFLLPSDVQDSSRLRNINVHDIKVYTRVFGVLDGGRTIDLTPTSGVDQKSSSSCETASSL